MNVQIYLDDNPANFSDQLSFALIPKQSGEPAALVWRPDKGPIPVARRLRVTAEDGSILYEGPFTAYTYKKDAILDAAAQRVRQSAEPYLVAVDWAKFFPDVVGKEPAQQAAAADRNDAFMHAVARSGLPKGPERRADLAQRVANLERGLRALHDTVHGQLQGPTPDLDLGPAKLDTQSAEYWKAQYEAENLRLNAELQRQLDPKALPVWAVTQLKQDAERINDLEAAYRSLKEEARTKVDELNDKFIQAHRASQEHTRQQQEFMRDAGKALGIPGEAYKQYGWGDIAQAVKAFAKRLEGLHRLLSQHQWEEISPDRWQCLCGGIFMEKPDRCSNIRGCWVEATKVLAKGSPRG